MHKNIAILLGVDDYQAPNQHLPACKNDISLMNNLIMRGGNFEEIIVLRSDDAEHVKLNLAQIVERFQQEEVKQLLFYFSGHGDYHNGDFHYLLRNYDEHRPSSTALSNAELDQMLRSLNPGLMVKIVDACYSGVPYIKDGSHAMEDLAEATKGKFSDTYFMFSSENDQKSYADKEGSDFTIAFARAIVNHSSEDVRYKSIIDYISDAFLHQQRQIPKFVGQANFTEVFGKYSTEAKELISNLLPTVAVTETNTERFTPVDREDKQLEEKDAMSPERSLLEKVREQAKSHASLDSAKKSIQSLHEFLASPPKDDVLTDLFDIEVSFSNDFRHLSRGEELGKWLLVNATGQYFASTTYTNEEYEVSTGLSAIYALTGGEEKKIKKIRRVVDSIESTLCTEMPFTQCFVTFQPKFENLKKYIGELTYILSKTRIQIFTRIDELTESSWGKFRVNNGTPWSQSTYMHNDATFPTIARDQFFLQNFSWIKDKVNKSLGDGEPSPT